MDILHSILSEYGRKELFNTISIFVNVSVNFLIFQVYEATKRCAGTESWNLCIFIKNTLNRLSALQSLDFGTEKTSHLND